MRLTSVKCCFLRPLKTEEKFGTTALDGEDDETGRDLIVTIGAVELLRWILRKVNFTIVLVEKWRWRNCSFLCFSPQD